MSARPDPLYVLEDLSAAAREIEALLDRARIALEMRWDDEATTHLHRARLRAHTLTDRLDKIGPQITEAKGSAWPPIYEEGP